MAKVIKYQLGIEIPYEVVVEVPLLDEEGNSVLREVKTPVTDEMGEPVFAENGKPLFDITYEPVMTEEVQQEVSVIFNDVSIRCPTQESYDVNYPIAEKEAYGEITVEGEFESVYDTAPRNILAGEYITINGVLYLALENIPGGEMIIVGQNAIETTVEQQLYEMKGE